jgi:hypothetical protein
VVPEFTAVELEPVEDWFDCCSPKD